ncbi:MAG TPA: hypothetical protein DDX75_10180 [Phycisphaerales bacterium]|nr:hypothetical protein [Phycisphaerales bacterium]
MKNNARGCDGYLFNCETKCEPVLISACLLGIPCRWHGRRPQKRDKLIERLKKKYVLLPVCPEQLEVCRRLGPAKNFMEQEHRFLTKT